MRGQATTELTWVSAAGRQRSPVDSFPVPMGIGYSLGPSGTHTHKFATQDRLRPPVTASSLGAATPTIARVFPLPQPHKVIFPRISSPSEANAPLSLLLIK